MNLSNFAKDRENHVSVETVYSGSSSLSVQANDNVLVPSEDLGFSDVRFDIVTVGEQCAKVCDIKVMQESTAETPTCWGLTLEELQAEQSKDKDLTIIIEWLLKSKGPDEGILFLASPEAKYYWVNKELFQLVDGVLFKQKLNSKDLELVVPNSLQEQTLVWHHNIPSSGHQEVARTKAKLKEKFFWVRLSRDTETFVLTCPVCNKNKKNKHYGRVPLTMYQAGAPMESAH